MMQLIERKQYMQILRNLKDQNIIKVITGVRRCGKSKGELATLLTGRYIETSILPLQFSEYYDFIQSKPPNLSKSESLAVYTVEGGVPEYFNQKNISEKQADETLERELAPLNAIKDSNPKYLLTTDLDLNPVYNGIRKLNVADWLLSKENL